MRRQIIIVLPTFSYSCDENTPLVDLKISSLIKFKHCTLVGAKQDFYTGEYLIIIENDIFDPTPYGYHLAEYSYDDAIKRYPFIAKDTNPLLWKKF